jgi:DNA-binding CsgD family transcriptional regulator
MLEKLREQLTKREAVALLDLSYESLRCEEEGDFKRLVQGLQAFLPFENAMCAHGNVSDFFGEEDSEALLDVCDINYPRGYLDFYFQEGFSRTDAVILEFISNLSPVNWRDVGKKCGFSYPVSVKAIDFGMIDGWSHGSLNPNTMNSTAFYFGSSVRDESAVRNRGILEYATPFLSGAYDRVLKKKARPAIKLTAREAEVLNWIKEGKSSWDISQILKCSERTVNFHVSNIKAKLGAVNRAQAVAVGLQYGGIRF